MPLLLSLILAALVAFAGAPTPSQDRPTRIRSLEDAASVEDPRALERAGRYWLTEGDAELARGLFERSFDVEEATRYLKLKPEHREALILERLGRFEEAAALYREQAKGQPLLTMLALRIMSEHPDRSLLFDEAVADVRGRVERAKLGSQETIYTTSKGDPRYLEVIPDDQAVARLIESGGSLRYCYIENLDLSLEAAPILPDGITLDQCVVGRVSLPDRDLSTFRFRGIALGDVSLGKSWAGEVNKSATILASRLEDVMFREAVLLGAANFQDLRTTGRNTYFALTVFEGPADFRDLIVEGVTDFRFSVFREGANLKGSKLLGAVYFGHSRYLGPVTFRGMYSEQDLFFDSTRFEGPASFDRCEWARGATFENARFEGPVSMNESEIGGRLNMSRAVFEDKLSIKELSLADLDFIGAWLRAPAEFIDLQVSGKVRFSLDDITRSQYLDDPSPLLSLYRDYQGDKDADEPLTSRSSYGVEHVDDLIARIDDDVSFANSVFAGFVIFERVQFGLPDAPHRAVFYNAQFQGESHFERTTWNANADFTTIFANELSLNEAAFHSGLVLDDANVAGRATLTDASFDESSTISFYGAEIASFQIDRDQIERPDGSHRLFYEGCALDGPQRDSPQLTRLLLDAPDLDVQELRQTCYDRVVDEFVAMKQSFGDRAMAPDEDWAYWWIKHHELMEQVRFGGIRGIVYGLIAWPIFELSFGWGVRLANLGLCLVVITFLFAGLYRWLCPETVMSYDGGDVPIKEIPWHGLVYISLQSLGAFNTGWDVGATDPRFRYLNTAETFLGIIILTFFVGAYTRLILA